VNSGSLVSVALAAILSMSTQSAQTASDVSELVRQLGQFPAAIDPRIQSNTGQRMPVEQQREAIYVRLRAFGASAVTALQRGMADPDVQIRRNVALYLGVEGGNYAKHAPEPLDLKPFLSHLARALHDDDERVKALSAQALEHVGPDAVIAVPDLIRLLEDPQEGLRNSACIGLAGIGPAARDALPALHRALTDPSVDVRRFAQRAIERIDVKPATADSFEVAAVLQLQTSALTGRVVDATGSAVPGATVRVSGSGGSVTTVSDPVGRFRVDELVDGSYLVIVSLAGFRTQTVTVRVDSSAAPELIVKLMTKVLSEVFWVVPKPADAYRMAAVIAHVRIDGTRRYGPCDAHVVTSYHDASVLRVFKGKVSTSIHLHQEAAGRCRELGEWREGTERPYRVSEEYVVFLTERPGGFGRLAGPSLAFRVRGDSVSLEGFAGVEGSISLNELGELLGRLSRVLPPDKRLQPAAKDGSNATH
jgi:HEAT repeat protein